jgi:hypothetical protein
MIQKILNTEEVRYASKLNFEHLKKKIEALFEQKTLRFKGKLTGENEFTVYDKFNVIGWSMPNLRRKSAYLKGEITQSEKGTLIKLRINPNSILPIFAILSTVVGGFILTFMALSTTKDDTFLSAIGLVFIVLGIVYYPLSTYFRNRLRNKIVKHLDLTKV